MMMTRTMGVSLLLIVALAGCGLVIYPAAAASEESVPCNDYSSAACPNPSSKDTDKIEGDCGLWLGPSPIKEAEDHGFGLGVFTGKPIPKGGSVEEEIMIPLYDSLLHDGLHPPLREYVWDGDNAPEVAVESRRGTFLFMPGLAAIAPCTSKNYNLEITGRGDRVGTPRHNILPDATGIHRYTSPMAGSFSYRHNVSYTAVRDIVAGEELTVQCNDDNYDGGAFYLSTFHAHDTDFVCVDNNVQVDLSDMGGRGLFAKHTLHEGSLITSTPLIPIDREEVVMKKRRKSNGEEDDHFLQLLLNYCFGHVHSDLLLLPYGPLVNYINHPPEGRTANAIIQWHDVPDKNSNDVLPRRQQYHHPELLELPAKHVAKTHGKGLMIDIVTLREIAPGEEIYIDYGSDWVDAYKAHVEAWKADSKYAKVKENYVSAADYDRRYDTSKILTVAEQMTNPYPSNLETACFYDEDDEDDEEDKETYYWSSAEEIDECLRPCIILGRYLHHEGGEEVYKAKMMPIDSDKEHIIPLCKLRSPEIVADVPRRAIRIVDRPYTTDTFLKSAFRHEIGVPEGFYPETWMKKKLRGQTQEESDADYGHEFKRKIP